MSSRTASFVSCISALVLMLVFATGAEAIEFGARGYYWFPGLKGDLRVDSGGTTGTEINLKDDLGIDNKNIPSVEIFAGFGKHHLSLMYSQVDFSGSKALTRNIVFQGTTFTSGTQVDSDFKLKMADLDYQYDVIDLKNILAGFSVGVIGKIKYIDTEASVRSAAVNRKETFSAPVPMVGVGANLGILANLLEARVKATGIAYSGSYFYDAMADISVTPFPFMDIHGGYRYMKLKVDNISNVYSNIELSGPFVALTIGW